MSREPVRAHLLYLGLLMAALMLFLVPEAQVESLRARSLSALSPVLRLFNTASRNHEPRPALITVPRAPAEPVAPAAPPPPNHSLELDEARAREVALRNEIARLRNALQRTAPAVSADAARAVNLAPPRGIAADVIARRVLWQEPVLGLSRGADDGVRLHAPVLCRGAVAGRIVSVGPRASCMALLTHRGMSVAARLAESRVEGIFQGAAAPKDAVVAADGAADAGRASEERLCRMSVVARELSLKEGECVVTSGYDGVFPAGLWLGVVTGWKKKGDVQWEVYVRPACDENAVECVEILTVASPDVPWPAAPKTRAGRR
jgi:rod shape-determining protein MreC